MIEQASKTRNHFAVHNTESYLYNLKGSHFQPTIQIQYKIVTVPVKIYL